MLRRFEKNTHAEVQREDASMAPGSSRARFTPDAADATQARLGVLRPTDQNLGSPRKAPHEEKEDGSTHPGTERNVENDSK